MLIISKIICNLSLYAIALMGLLVSNSVIPIHLLGSANGISADPSLIQLPIEVSSQSVFKVPQKEIPFSTSANQQKENIQNTKHNDNEDSSINDQGLSQSQNTGEKDSKQQIIHENSKEHENASNEEKYNEDNKKEESYLNSNYHHKTSSGGGSQDNNNSGQNNQNGPRNIKGPVKLTFVDSYWTNNVAPETVVASISSGQLTAQQMAPVARQEVSPGEGNSVLAVTVINQGFSDISGVKGYFDFPNGFKALVTPDNVDSDTAISTYNGVVKAGQSFVLYFPVNISSNTQIGKEYHGDLKIKYFKLTEQTKKDFRTASIEVPFRLTGKVLIEIRGSGDVSTVSNLNGNNNGNSITNPDILNAKAGMSNKLNIKVSNVGNAVANGVTVDVLNSDTQVATNGNNVDTPDNSTIQSSRTSTQVPYINLGNTVFDIGTITPNQQFSIDPVIFPPASSGNVLQNIDIRVSYNDAYGNKKTLNHMMGIQIVPSSPQNDFYISPANSDAGIEGTYQTLESSQSKFGETAKEIELPRIMTAANIYPYQPFPIRAILAPYEQSQSSPNYKMISSQGVNAENKNLEIVAGKLQNISFSLNNFENTQSSYISNLGVTITPQSPAVKIVGRSVWNIQDLHSGSNTLSTNVFAAPSLIGNPVFFTIKVQYLKNNQESKTASFNLGAIVNGEIKPSINDLQIRPIGNTYNLVGNVLNQGNAIAQFSKIQIGEQEQPSLQRNQTSHFTGINYQPDLGEYLGNLPVNEPVPFNIPLSNNDISILRDLANNEITGDNPQSSITISLPLIITYTDSIQEVRQIQTSSSLTMDNSIIKENGTSTINNGFVDSYWAVDAPLESNSASTSNSFTKSTIQKAVAPGDGSSILAVELTNNGFSDISGLTGYLKLPSGFQKESSGIRAGVSGLPQPDTESAVASNGNVIKSGQTFTLYFKVDILDSAKIGGYSADLSLYYFKVPDNKIGTYRLQDITVPFLVTGVPILDSTTNVTDLEPGVNNPVKIIIHNRGTAAATGSIVQLSESDQTVVSDSAASQVTSNESSVEDLQQDSASMPLINSGQSTFSLKTIPAGGSVEFVTNVIPSINSVESLQKMNLEITFVNPVGATNSVNKVIGFRVLPNPPDGGLSVSASNPNNNTVGGLSVSASNPNNNTVGGLSVSASNPNNNTVGGSNLSTSLSQKEGTERQNVDTVFVSGNQENEKSNANTNSKNMDPLRYISSADPKSINQLGLSGKNNSTSHLKSQTVFITAGKIDDFKFNISNNNNNEIRNAVVTLSVNSGSLEILGNSKWNVGTLQSGSTLNLSTKIFAATSLINSPVSFKVSIEYVSKGQLKDDSFSVGANVVGDINVSVTDVSVDNIGGVLNAVGSLLNKGNTGGLFTTVELVTDKSKLNAEINKLSQNGENVTGLKIVTAQSTTPQYLGDLEEDSPLPFNIPLSTSNKSSPGNYMVPLKIQYYDDLRNLYTIFSSSIVNVDLPHNNNNESSGIGNLFSPSNPIGLILLIIIIIIVLFVIRRLHKRRNSNQIKTNKKIGEGKSFIDLLDSVKKGDDKEIKK